MGGPGAFDAAGHGVATNATAFFVEPAKALGFQIFALGVGAQVSGAAVAVGLADGVSTGRQGCGLLVVHGHAGKGHTHVVSGTQGIRLAANAFGVDVDQAHLHGSQRVLERCAVSALALVAVSSQPLFLGAPVDVLLGVPDVFATKAKAVGLQTHGLVGHVAGENKQVSPRQLVAVLPLDGPQQTAAFVKVAVVRPGVQGGKSLGTRACAATAVGDTVGAGCVPGQTNHQATVVTPVSGPPGLAVGHQCSEVFLNSRNVELLDFLTVVEALEWVGLGVVLVEDVQVQGGGPPLHVGRRAGGVATMHDGTLGHIVHVSLLIEDGWTLSPDHRLFT